jgi:exonuclease III
MRIVSWNLNHRACRRSIPDWIVEEIATARPDVLVCTEYVEAAEHHSFVSALKNAGLASVSTTVVKPRQNQILMATRLPHRAGQIPPPTDIDGSVSSNALHVTVGGIDVLGMRMPAYVREAERLKRLTWAWVHDAATRLINSPAIIVGDMNTQRGDSKRSCGDCIESLIASGWSPVIPATGYSWKHPRSGLERRIDFAFVSPSLTAKGATYSWDFVNRNAIGAMKVGIPDHAMLSIEAELPPSVPALGV